jgi:hypothetical protein
MRSKIILAIASSLAFTAAAFGQTWLNPAGGSWEDPANWSNGMPHYGAPVFDLGSVAGYTVTTSGEETGPFKVENDNVTLVMNGQIQCAALTVSPNASLTLEGPQEFVSTGGGDGSGVGSVTVANNSQLVVNGATMIQQGEAESAAFNVSDLVVENGGDVNLSAPASYMVGQGTFDDGKFEAPLGSTLSLGQTGQISLTNHSNISGDTVSLGDATVDNSSIGSDTSISIGGSNTVQDHGGINGVAMDVAGTITILPTGSISSGQLSVEGTLSVELNGLVSEPIDEPFSGNSGTLDLTLQSGFNPTLGEQFHIFPSTDPQFGDTGTFATLNLPALGGESWDISDLYTTGVITVVPEPLSTAMLAIAAFGILPRRTMKRGV